MGQGIPKSSSLVVVLLVFMGRDDGRGPSTRCGRFVTQCGMTSPPFLHGVLDGAPSRDECADRSSSTKHADTHRRRLRFDESRPRLAWRPGQRLDPGPAPVGRYVVGLGLQGFGFPHSASVAP